MISVTPLVTPQSPNPLVQATVSAPACVVQRVSNQSISDITDSLIDFAATAAVEVDTHTMFDTGNPDCLTVKRAGLYYVSACVRFASNTTGIRHVWIVVNGTTEFRATAAPVSGTLWMNVSGIVTCAVGNTIELYVRQSSGGALNVEYDDTGPKLEAVWLREV